MNTKGNKVVFCLCGCGKLVMAACMPDAVENAGLVERFAAWEAKGARIEYASSEYVRGNWNEHLGELPTGPAVVAAVPVQLSLF